MTKKVETCHSLIGLANLSNSCWFIIGNIYVFKNWSSYNSDDNTFQCDDITYMFSFVLLIMAWVAIPILSLLACLCGAAVMECLEMASN